MRELAETNTLLRISSAGSVDDGKSTLIGRLLYEAKALFDDQLAAIEKQKRVAGQLDLSLITDGLKSEREQGITIDVAYRYFASSHRKYILADAPGHVQYTRNMVTAASLADTAIILVDARQGVVEQTRRHSFIVHLLGVRHLILAINKIDLIAYDAERIAAIEQDFRRLDWVCDHKSLHIIPVSALMGDNITSLSAHTPWYQGPSLMDLLDSLPAGERVEGSPELPIQHLVRSGKGERLALGTLRQGRIKVHDPIQIYPSRQKSHVAKIYVAGKEAQEAVAGQAVAIALADERDMERGWALSEPDRPWLSVGSIRANLVWFDDESSVGGTRYLLRGGVQTSPAWIDSILDCYDLQTLSRHPVPCLKTNDIARVELRLSRPLAMKPFTENSYAGAFILVDPRSNRTVAAGMVDEIITTDEGYKGNGSLRFVDRLSESQSQAKEHEVQVPDSFLKVNDERVLKRFFDSLVDLGWDLRIERGVAGRMLEESFENKAFKKDRPRH